MDKPQSKCFQDFIVCLDELKTPPTSLDNEVTIGRVLQYLTNALKVQNRRKIYGFLANFTHITFYCTEKKPYSTSYNYYKSQNFKLFDSFSELSSSVGTKRNLNKETWKIFTTYLTMNPNFYQYTTLNINPLDDLRGDRYSISKEKRLSFALLKVKPVFLLRSVELFS
ncbi:unnamed protein product [Rotaria socialis]|uniref:Uncharacterized protein n=1 Tax=Rotaria socialis TaxID=392032 RepID=A0A818AY58_9BILA|nr:unnamed protein product [Rotaria socialis]CAF4851839.1 unnamed protein product [Rotaria socialis]